MIERLNVPSLFGSFDRLRCLPISDGWAFWIHPKVGIFLVGRFLTLFGLLGGCVVVHPPPHVWHGPPMDRPSLRSRLRKERRSGLFLPRSFHPPPIIPRNHRAVPPWSRPHRRQFHVPPRSHSTRIRATRRLGNELLRLRNDPCERTEHLKKRRRWIQERGTSVRNRRKGAVHPRRRRCDFYQPPTSTTPRRSNSTNGRVSIAHVRSEQRKGTPKQDLANTIRER